MPRSLTVEGSVVTVPSQMRPGIASQVTSVFCPGTRRPMSGSSTYARTRTFERSATCSRQVAGLHVGALLHGQHIHDAVEGRDDVGLVQNVFGGRVGSLRIGLLRGHVLDLRLRVAFFLFLREQVEVGLRALQRVLRFFHFARRSGALFLQALECFEIALRGVAVGARLDDLGLQGQDFFLRSAVLQCSVRRPARP